MSIRYASAVLCFSAILSGAAHADSSVAARLQGLNGMELVIDDLLQPASGQCGVTRETIDKAVRSTFRGSRMDLVKTLHHANLYVNVKILSLDSARHCVFDANIEVRSPVIILTNGEFIWATIWNRWTISSAPKDKASRELSDTLKNMAGLLLADWNLANPVQAGDKLPQP